MKSVITTSLVAATTLFAASQSVSAYSGIFGYGVELQATGAGATHSGTTLYALNNDGGDRLLPTGSSATLDQTSWLGSPETTPTFDLGTFDPGTDSLVLQGFSMLTYQGDGEQIGEFVYGNYRVSPVGGTMASWAPGIQLPLNETDVSGASGDLRFAEESAGVNLLAGLAPGEYVLGTYGYAASDRGENFVGNGGANYGATFTVVPEPASLGLLGVLGLMLGRRRQR